MEIWVKEKMVQCKRGDSTGGWSQIALFVKRGGKGLQKRYTERIRKIKSPWGERITRLGGTTRTSGYYAVAQFEDKKRCDIVRMRVAFSSTLADAKERARGSTSNTQWMLRNSGPIHKR
jgi:hypothetical protein